LVLDSECFASVGGVGLESLKHLAFLGGGEGSSRDDSDLLLLVEGSVVPLVLLGDFLDEVKTLVFGKNFHESHSLGAERSSFKESSVESLDFSLTDTLVIGEHSEVFRVLVEVTDVRHVFVDSKELLVHRCGGEQDRGVPSFDSLFLDGADVSFNGVDSGNISS